jgi:hypothetical protein
MQKDTITLSAFVRIEERKSEKTLKRLEQEHLRVIARLKALRNFENFRRILHEEYPKKWTLREHAGDFSQSLDRFIGL